MHKLGERHNKNRPIPNEELNLKKTFNGARAKARGFGQPTHQHRGSMVAQAPAPENKGTIDEDGTGSSRGIPPKPHMRGQGGHQSNHGGR